MKLLRSVITLALAVLCLAVPATSQTFPGASGNPSVLSRPGGTFYAPAFSWSGRVISGNTATGSQTIIIAGNAGGAGGLQLPDGSTLSLGTIFSGALMPMVIDFGQGNQETVTPTAVSVSTCPAGNLGVGGSSQCVFFTGTFVNTHGQSAVVVDGTFGLQTAINYAAGIFSGTLPTPGAGTLATSGGTVVVDAAWAQMGGTTAIINAAVPYPSVTIRDDRGSRAQWYSVYPSSSAVLATPTTLVANATCGAGTTVCSGTAGSLGGVNATWTSATKHFCVTYVDIQGHEGPCSLDASFTTTASVVVQVTAPAASTGAVGYLVYAGATFAGATRLPIVGGATGGPTCTLTTVESVTPACAVTNATYNQTGSNATFALINATTQPQPPGTTITSFTTLQAFDQSHSAYAYQQTNIPAPNYTTGFPAFTASTGTSGTSWELGRALLPIGFMNTIGKTIRVSGQITGTGNTVPTAEVDVDMGPPWTGSIGAKVCSSVNTTAESAVVWNITFSCTITTQTVSVAAGTGGTVLGNGWYMQQFTTGTTAGNLAVNNTVAAVTVNLFGATEVEIVLTPTSSTGITSPQLIQLSVEALN